MLVPSVCNGCEHEKKKKKNHLGNCKRCLNVRVAYGNYPGETVHIVNHTFSREKELERSH